MSLAVEQLEPGVLASARYGKDKVRVFRVVRDPESKVHNVVEYNVTVLVEGAIETSYTQGDNSVVVATDSMKNITNCKGGFTSSNALLSPPPIQRSN